MTWSLYRKGWNIYGPGRCPIDKPEDFQQASTLFVCEMNKGGVWEVRGVKFDGDQKIGGNYVATGTGSTCPSSAFR